MPSLPVGRWVFVSFAVLVFSLPSRAAEFVIGMTTSQSGVFATASQEQQRGLELWVEEANRRGGVLGRRVVLHVQDDQSRPDVAVKHYEQFIAEHRPVVVMGPYSSPSTDAVAGVVEKFGVPMISAGASSTDIWSRGRTNVFGLYTPAASHLSEMIEWARGRGLKRVGILYEDSPFQRDAAMGAKARAKALGMVIAHEEKYARGQTDFAPTFAKLKTRKLDVLLGASYLADSVAILRQARESKFYARVIGFTVGPVLSEFGAQLSLDAEGVLGSSQWEVAAEYPGVQEFVARFRARHGRLPTVESAGGFASGEVLEAALKKAGAADRDKLRAALRDLDMMTVLGPYRVTEDGRQAGKSAYVVQWNNGMRELVLPASSTDLKPSYPFRDWSRR